MKRKDNKRKNKDFNSVIFGFSIFSFVLTVLLVLGIVGYPIIVGLSNLFVAVYYFILIIVVILTLGLLLLKEDFRNLFSKEEVNSFQDENEEMFFTNISEEEITEAVIDRIMDMKKYPSDEKITEIAFEEMYEILVEEIKEPTYSDEKIVQSVGVHKDEDGMYYISEEDMLALDNVFFDLENK